MIDAINLNALLYAGLGTGVTFLCTALGAAAVFLVKPATDAASASRAKFMETISLGFAAGIMIAAAVWSLLIPALDMVESSGGIPWLWGTGGFLAGALFLKLLDSAMPHLHPGAAAPEGPKSKLHRAELLFIAITLHNMPEGGSVGLSAGLAGLSESPAALTTAIALALGIGIQNIPEGAAVSLPMAQQGMSRMKAFLYGALSGAVEPVCAIVTVLAIPVFLPAMPFLLAFAAGAMIYVVVEELIPAAHLSEHSDAGTLAVIAGFALMMALDTALG